MKKKILALILAAACVLGLTACGTAKSDEASKTAEASVSAVSEASAEKSSAEAPVQSAPASGNIVVLYTNDIHCAVNGNMGYESVASARSALEKAGNDVLLVDAGDAVQGGLAGTLSRGEGIIKIMNALKYDAACPGNHEVDYGLDRLLELTEMAEFPYVCCNMLDPDGELFYPSWTMLEAGGKKLAFIGILTPTSQTTIAKKAITDEAGNLTVSFCAENEGRDLYDRVQAAADEARQAGADVVIALSHLGIAGDGPFTSSNTIANTAGIDVFLDGHSHSVVEEELVKNKEGKDVLLTQTGTALAAIGMLTITPDGRLSSALITDDGASAVIGAVNKETEELGAVVVGHTGFDVTINAPKTGEAEEKPVRLIRNMETNLGDLVADAYRDIAGTDIAFANGGSIRTSINAGEIKYSDIVAVLPFDSVLAVKELTGQTILDMLEFGVSLAPGESGGFLQVSGITMDVDLSVPTPVKMTDAGDFVGIDGERRVSNVCINGESIDPEKVYTAASANFTFNGGDGFSMLADIPYMKDNMMVYNQALIDYITGTLKGEIPEEYQDPYGQGRINFIK